MTALFLLCFLATALFQSVHSLSQSIEEIANEHLENDLPELKEMTDALQQSLFEIVNAKDVATLEMNQVKARLLRVHEKCLSDDLMNHATVLKSWDFDSCVNFTDSCTETQYLIFEGLKKAWNVSSTLGNLIMDALDCPSHLLSVLSCYNKNFSLLRETIIENKLWIKNFFGRAKKALTEVRYEFDMCLGIPLPNQTFVKTYLDSIPPDCVNKS